MRRSAVVDDLLKGFRDNPTAGRHIKMVFQNEIAADYDGVFRDCLTAFWGRVFDLYFDGVMDACRT